MSSMKKEDDSLLEEHLLKHYVSADENRKNSDDIEESSDKKSKSLDKNKTAEEIHFLVDEIQEHLDVEMEKIMFQIANPLAGRNVGILMNFVRHVIDARAEQMHAENETQTKPRAAEEAETKQIDVVKPENKEQIIGMIIPPAPKMMIVNGPTFPDIPIEDHYELSALDAEREGNADETEIRIIHIPLAMDDENNEIVASAEYDEREGVYRLSEPEMDERRHALLLQLKKDITDAGMLKNSRALQKQIKKSAKRINIPTDDEDYFVLKYYLFRDIAFAGPASALLNDQKIDAIICEGPGTPLMVLREGKRIRTNVLFRSREELNDFIKHLAEKLLQTVNVDNPVIDVVYKNFRVQGTLGTNIVPSRFLMTRIQ